MPSRIPCFGSLFCLKNDAQRGGERLGVAQLAGDDDAAVERHARHLQELMRAVGLDVCGRDLRRADAEANDLLAAAGALALAPRRAGALLLLLLLLLGVGLVDDGRHLGRKLRDRQVDRLGGVGRLGRRVELPVRIAVARSILLAAERKLALPERRALVSRLGVGQLVDGLERGLERRARGPIRLRARRSAGTPARARTSARARTRAR